MNHTKQILIKQAVFKTLGKALLSTGGAVSKSVGSTTGSSASKAVGWLGRKIAAHPFFHMFVTVPAGFEVAKGMKSMKPSNPQMMEVRAESKLAEGTTKAVWDKTLKALDVIAGATGKGVEHAGKTLQTPYGKILLPASIAAILLAPTAKRKFQAYRAKQEDGYYYDYPSGA